MSELDRSLLIAELLAAMREHDPCGLSEDEQRWVKLAIKQQEQNIRLRQAIIEKTLAGLAWAVVVGFGLMLLEWAKQHGYKS